jgi:peroxiredoxin Q/BCP
MEVDTAPQRPFELMKIFAIAAPIVLGLLAGLAYLLFSVKGDPPAVGDTAPEFSLVSNEENAVSLSDYQGQWVVLYFYPKDFTSGCTIQAHNFERDIEQYEARNAVVLGVSVDDVESHKEFCAKEGLSFKLLADIGGVVSESYGSVRGAGSAVVSARNTFLIDPEGVVAEVYLGVSVQKHSVEVLARLDELQGS